MGRRQWHDLAGDLADPDRSGLLLASRPFLVVSTIEGLDPIAVEDRLSVIVIPGERAAIGTDPLGGDRCVDLLDELCIFELTTERLDIAQGGVVGRIGGVVDLLPKSRAASGSLLTLGGRARPLGIIEVEGDRQYPGGGIGEEPREPRRVRRPVRRGTGSGLPRFGGFLTPGLGEASPISSVIPRNWPPRPISIASFTGRSSNAGSSSIRSRTASS